MGKGTHKDPMVNKPPSAHFCFRLICKARSIGIGTSSTRKSVTTLRMLFHRYRSAECKQVPLRNGFQNLAIGSHWKKSARQMASM